MKSTVMSRTSTIVAVAVGCGLWVVALPARSVEGIREERGLGATIIYVTHRNYKWDYVNAAMNGVLVHGGSDEETEAIKECTGSLKGDLIPRPPAVVDRGNEFADCMLKRYPH